MVITLEPKNLGKDVETIIRYYKSSNNKKDSAQKFINSCLDEREVLEVHISDLMFSSGIHYDKVVVLVRKQKQNVTDFLKK